MSYNYEEHFVVDQDGNRTCFCPFDGVCIECQKPCNDHDLVADWYWCDSCIKAAWEKDPALKIIEKFLGDEDFSL